MLKLMTKMNLISMRLQRLEKNAKAGVDNVFPRVKGDGFIFASRVAESDYDFSGVGLD